MADKDEAEGKEKAEEKAEGRADADAGTKLDRVLSALDAACARMDAMEKRMDADDDRRERDDAARKDAARKDEEGEGEDDKPPPFAAKDKAKPRKDSEGEEEGDEGKPVETAADRKDKARKDADPEEAEAEARQDSVVMSRADLNEMRETVRLQGEQLADLRRVQPRSRTDADFHALAEQQARFDSVYQPLGLGPVPMPYTSEPVDDYRLRVLTGLKKFSPSWKDANLYTVAADSAVLAICDRQIFAEAQEAARKPADLRPGQLREVRKPDVTGRVITEFVGPNSFVMGMKASARKVQRFRHNDRSVN